jgi:hypothetical protein
VFAKARPPYLPTMTPKILYKKYNIFQLNKNKIKYPNLIKSKLFYKKYGKKLIK